MTNSWRNSEHFCLKSPPLPKWPMGFARAQSFVNDRGYQRSTISSPYWGWEIPDALAARWRRSSALLWSILAMSIHCFRGCKMANGSDVDVDEPHSQLSLTATTIQWKHVNTPHLVPFICKISSSSFTCTYRRARYLQVSCFQLACGLWGLKPSPSDEPNTFAITLQPTSVSLRFLYT